MYIRWWILRIGMSYLKNFRKIKMDWSVINKVDELKHM